MPGKNTMRFAQHTQCHRNEGLSLGQQTFKESISRHKEKKRVVSSDT